MINWCTLQSAFRVDWIDLNSATNKQYFKRSSIQKESTVVPPMSVYGNSEMQPVTN